MEPKFCTHVLLACPEPVQKTRTKSQLISNFKARLKYHDNAISVATAVRHPQFFSSPENWHACMPSSHLPVRQRKTRVNRRRGRPVTHLCCSLTTDTQLCPKRRGDHEICPVCPSRPPSLRRLQFSRAKMKQVSPRNAPVRGSPCIILKLVYNVSYSESSTFCV